MEESITLLDVLRVLIPVFVVGVPLLIKIGRLQQAVLHSKEALDRIERAQEELLRREVFVSEIRGLETRLQQIEARLVRVEDRTSHASST